MYHLKALTSETDIETCMSARVFHKQKLDWTFELSHLESNVSVHINGGKKGILGDGNSPQIIIPTYSISFLYPLAPEVRWSQEL